MPALDNQSTAAARYFQLVRQFCARRQNWQSAIRYETKPDERYDLTLVSKRVYGRRDEFLTIQAAASLDSPESPLTERLLVLPTENQMNVFKRTAGFVNSAQQRQ
jgi:hypothetical protein